MNSILKQDLFRYEGQSNKKFLIKLKYIFFVPGFTYTYFFRKYASSNIFPFKLLYKSILRFTSYITNIQIPPGTEIGPGMKIGHWGNIVVNPSAKIGANFNISQGVLIGNSEGKMKGTPIIGNNVCINANAIVIGRCKIGNYVLIAPGAFVNFDVPDNSIVIGNPGKIIAKEKPTKKYMVYPIEEYL